MIRTFRVTGLPGKEPLDCSLHADVNLLTGKNGSGKTTLLKLMWYMISGNVERITSEVSFTSAEIETDSYKLRLETKTIRNSPGLAWTFTVPNSEPQSGSASVASDRIEVVNQLVIKQGGASLFFPTFRRIEGGFSMGLSQRTRFRDVEGSVVYSHGIDPYQIQSSLASLSGRLTVQNNQFIASISTDDVVAMLTRQYANMSEQVNEDHRKLSEDIFAMTATPRGGNPDPQATLNHIEERVRQHSSLQEKRLGPFTALGDLIGRIFRHKGIAVTSRVTLGQAQEAIASDKLSAGEKQMLSFLVYNAFTTNGVIFIDEPEISLHVDWQRQLLPLLIKQGTGNQFIIATHSPFVYTPYSDKEILLDRDRGDSLTPQPPNHGE